MNDDTGKKEEVQAMQDASTQAANQGGQTEPGKEEPIGEGAASATGQNTAPVQQIPSSSAVGHIEEKEETLAGKVEYAFEAFRERLVNLVGDIPGVHNTINDAKAAIAPHVGK